MSFMQLTVVGTGEELVDDLMLQAVEDVTSFGLRKCRQERQL
jgi:hypothetical protein